ncbi:hypothetical protein GCM10009555_008380 [Acrocarpospora macrocephala]|uniref:DUF4386 domain-containing protein n=1 Tax=Acrocarpospora macrocephala TaxID=150177 RepID=A0A5M3X439_9ACTN|nr:DUF4386 domain-containing protein [Acrocarpospora macrocephala]GES14879.1 hypothetical protein Amac_084760 [Acrocarpospora macrocephala]
MDSPKRLARTAGLFYLIVAILGGFAQIVRLDVFAPGDAATTVANVVANASLVRMSFVADLTQATFLLFVVMCLYRLLQHVNKGVARAMVLFVVVAVAIICLNMLHQLGGLLVATDPSYAGAFGPEGSPALVLLLFDLQHSGYLIAQIFFGLWLFPLGLLAYRSGMFPRPLAVTLMVATVFYLLDVALQFLAPELAGLVNPLVVVVATVSEVSMLAYLLIKGVRTLPADHALAT